MKIDLSGKNLYAAASSKGLGYGVALEGARAGAKVLLGSRSEKHLDKALKAISEDPEVEKSGGSVQPAKLDVTSPASIKEWFCQGEAMVGQPNMLFVNAGGPPPGTFEDFDDEEWQKAFELTLLSAVRLIREGSSRLIARGVKGSILVSTSLTVKEPVPGMVLSNVFRSGVASLAKTLSKDFTPRGIRVNHIVPGGIDTDRARNLIQDRMKKNSTTEEEETKRWSTTIPMARLGTIEEFGRAGIFLLSDAASYISGETLLVDGGGSVTVW